MFFCKGCNSLCTSRNSNSLEGLSTSWQKKVIHHACYRVVGSFWFGTIQTIYTAKMYPKLWCKSKLYQDPNFCNTLPHELTARTKNDVSKVLEGRGRGGNFGYGTTFSRVNTGWVIVISESSLVTIICHHQPVENKVLILYGKQHTR